jgi:hypothetical protein
MLPLLAAFTAAALPPAERCPAAELRVSAPEGDWFDLYVDGQLRVESRNFDGQQVVRLAPGTHHVRVMDFVGTEIWSQDRHAFGCGDVVIAHVRDGRGLHVVNSWSTAPPPPPVRVAHGGYGRPVGHRGTRRGPVRRPPARPVHTVRTCAAGELSVTGFDNAWFDLYVDGRLQVESRNARGRASVVGLAPGRHHVEVRTFTGRYLNDLVVDVRCGERIAGEVVDGRGLRLF